MVLCNHCNHCNLVTNNGVCGKLVTFGPYMMYCPEFCYNDPDEDERCCCCEAVTCWKLDQVACNVTIGQLNVEYTDIYGSAVFVPSGNRTIYEAVHRHGRLTKFPVNLCDYADSLVTLDLSFNRIKDISSIRCLKKLDTLRLDSNEITELSNETFTDMEYLRVLSMSRNFIETLYPNTFKNKDGNILVIDFSYNIIESIDVTNIVRPGPFCNMSCEGCEFSTQTNELNYVMHENNIHGPGTIILRNTSTNSFLNFSALGMNDYTTLGRFFKGRFEYDESVIDCDCKIYPFLFGLGKDASKYWPRLGIHNVTCKLPENMKGRNLNEMYQTQTFEELTCDLPNCPKGCTCTDKPADDEIKVVCKGLRSMPDFTPIGYWNNDKINLDCSDPSNEISNLPNNEYIGRLVGLKLEGNSIRRLDDSAVENLSEDVYIDMSGQELKSLPASFRKLNPNRIIFGTHPIDCNCDNVWIGDWVRNNKAAGNLKCITSQGLVPAERISSEFLDCFTTRTVPGYVPILLGILVALPLLLSVIVYHFRYEVMLLKRKFCNKKVKGDDFEFDIMLTFSEENSEVFRLIERYILPALQREGYSVFVPFYDILFGSNRDDKISEGSCRSRNYVVFLCNKYLCDENSVQEFESVWKQFSSNTFKHIIVVNFDNFSSSEIMNRRLRAFRRIKDDLNFIEREVKLYERLKHRLGPPRNEYFTQMKNSVVVRDLEEYAEDDIKVNENDEVSDKLKNENYKTFYNRLAQPRKTICNCKYRKCYLHNNDGSWFVMPSKAEIARQRRLKNKTSCAN